MDSLFLPCVNDYAYVFGMPHGNLEFVANCSSLAVDQYSFEGEYEFKV